MRAHALAMRKFDIHVAPSRSNVRPAISSGQGDAILPRRPHIVHASNRAEPEPNCDCGDTIEPNSASLFSRRHSLLVGGILSASQLIQAQAHVSMDYLTMDYTARVSSPAAIKRQIALVAVALEQRKEKLDSMTSLLNKYSYLASLHEIEPDSFYKLIRQYPDDLLPIIYTPGVGDACLNWNSLKPAPTGLVLSSNTRDQFERQLRAWPGSSEIKAIVVTDGNRILGLGDLGANGLGISFGKCTLYSVAGGLKPSQLLPVVLDVGCSNESVRNSPAYFGIVQDRVTGSNYEDIVDEFHSAVQAVFGKQVLIHWEDFSSDNGFKFLEKYRMKGPTFNDDIQSTAAVALAAVLGSCRMPRVRRLEDQVFMLVGAGQAGLGIAGLLVQALVDVGLTEEAAKRHIWMVDSRGLIVENREKVGPLKAEFAQPPAALMALGISDYSQPLPEIIAALRPTCLIGATGKSSTFTPAMLSTMASSMPPLECVPPPPPTSQSVPTTALPDATPVTLEGTPATEPIQESLTVPVNDPPTVPANVSSKGTCTAALFRPVVFALSNPTTNSECTFQEAYNATDGQVVFASGTQFPSIRPVVGPELKAAQANNCMVFPGLGAGCVYAGSTGVPDDFFLVAAKALAAETSDAEIASGLVIPAISRIRDAALAVATAVATASNVNMLTTFSESNVAVFKAVTDSLQPNLSGAEIAVRKFVVRRTIDASRY